MFHEFKEFAFRGNVIDLAVGVVLGAAFNAIVGSMVADIFMPLIGILTGGYDFSKHSYAVGDAVITYGKFLQAVFIFLLTAIALFVFVKAVNRFRRKKEIQEAATPPPPPADIVLLTEIRDLLRSK